MADTSYQSGVKLSVVYSEIVSHAIVTVNETASHFFYLIPSYFEAGMILPVSVYEVYCIDYNWLFLFAVYQIIAIQSYADITPQTINYN